MLGGWLLSSSIGRGLIAATAGAALCAAVYLIGYNDGQTSTSRAAEIASLKAHLQIARQDLDAQRIAAESSRRSAIENGRAATEAQERIDAYEAELQARGADARCLIGDDDLRRLRQYGIGSDEAAAAGR